MSDLKQKIETAVKNTHKASFDRNATELLNIMGYRSERRADINLDFFKEHIDIKKHERIRFDGWLNTQMIFQITFDEIAEQLDIFHNDSFDKSFFNSYLFIAVQLEEGHYTRTELSAINREINRCFAMPVMVLIEYGQMLTFAITARRPNKREQHKDVLDKVTLIKDIDRVNPHRAHIEILHDLALENLKRNHTINNFNELHDAWQKTLDISELNKKFYKELQQWYFWALNEVVFPDPSLSHGEKPPKENEKTKEHNAKNLIRMLTRLLFV